MSTYRTLIRRLPALAVAAALAAATPALAETIGPQGESATPSQTVTVSDAGAATLKGGGHTAALLWHDQSDFVNAVTAGATDEFDRLGIEVIATTNAAFDAAKQRSDIETALVKQPSIILALPLDPVTSAEAFRAAVADGVKLVFLSNLPSGYEHGVDYAAIVTDDLFQMGKQAADALAEAMGGSGTVGWIFHDATYYVTNQRDNAFKTTIESDYPDITIVAEQGISDPARAEEIANAMLLRHPDLGGVYVTWAGPAEGVLASLRASGNKTTRIVTLDLSEPIALDMVQGGNVVAIVADEAYELGRAMAAAGARALLGEETPPFVVAPAITVTADNVAEGWQTSLNRDAPKSVMEAQIGAASNGRPRPGDAPVGHERRARPGPAAGYAGIDREAEVDREDREHHGRPVATRDRLRSAQLRSAQLRGLSRLSGDLPLLHGDAGPVRLHQRPQSVQHHPADRAVDGAGGREWCSCCPRARSTCRSARSSPWRPWPPRSSWASCPWRSGSLPAWARGSWWGC